MSVTDGPSTTTPTPAVGETPLISGKRSSTAVEPGAGNRRLFVDALYGLIFWALVGTAGIVVFGTIEGVALWRVVFITGYAGYMMGLMTAND